MKLRRLLRTKDRVSSSRRLRRVVTHEDGERTLTVEESLQSIAVELHRSNDIAVRQAALVEKFVDLAVANQKLIDTGGSSDSLRLVEKLLEPIGALLSHKLSRPPVITSEVGKSPATVTHAGNGTRVEQAPPEH